MSTLSHYDAALPSEKSPHIVIGAGPAGLAAAHTLANLGHPVLVIEQSDRVGGLSTSIVHHGCTLDLGPHFFNPSKTDAIDLWNRVLGDQQVNIEIRTKMFWDGRWYSYPPKAKECIGNLGPLESGRIFASLLQRRLSRPSPSVSYADVARIEYGDRLFSNCFSPYVEKLLGVPCDQVSPNWKPGRLRSTSLFTTLRDAAVRKKDSTVPHPLRGAGQFYDRMASQILELGGRILMQREVTALEHDGGRIVRLRLKDLRTNESETFDVQRSLISSVPAPLLIRLLLPCPPTEAITPTTSLKFRSTVLVYVFVTGVNPFTEQCRYIMSPEIRLGRVTNFANWSPEMVANAKVLPLCCEYWCTHNDGTWRHSDDELCQQAIFDLVELSLIDRKDVAFTVIHRLQRTHPVPTLAHAEADNPYTERIVNLHMVGRAGSFSYVDQDDALIMGIRAAKAATLDAKQEDSIQYA